MKFSGVITIGRSDVHAKGHGQKSKVKVTEAKTQFSHFRTFEVTRDKKNRRFWPELGVSGPQLQFKLTHGYEMMHKTWSSIEEVFYCFSRSSVKL